jgi:hypothetical protein
MLYSKKRKEKKKRARLDILKPTYEEWFIVKY